MTQILLDGIPSAEVEHRWGEIAALVGRAVAENGAWYTTDSIREAAKAGDMQIWRISGPERLLGVGVTEIRNYPSGRRICWIFALAGVEFDSWAHCIDTIKEWAKANGCHSVAMHGRKGWVKKLKGWRELAVVLETGV